MPDEIEVPLDSVQDHVTELHEKRHHHGHNDEAHPPSDKSGWLNYVAVITAILAVIAAIGALQSGLLVNEALLAKNEQIGKLTQASDTWNYYQAEGLKSLIYKTAAQGLPPGSSTAKSDIADSKRYQAKQNNLSEEATKLTNDSKGADRAAERYLDRHHIFAISVSLCQIAIALSAVAAITKRKRVWIIGVGSGTIGTALLLYGFLIGRGGN